MKFCIYTIIHDGKKYHELTICDCYGKFISKKQYTSKIALLKAIDKAYWQGKY